MGTINKDKRARIVALVLEFMNIMDKTGKNAAHWKSKLDDMSDAALKEWLEKLESSKDHHFYLQVTPWDNEPSLNDIEKAAKLVGTKLEQYVYFRHDGSANDPDRSATRCPCGYLHIRRLQQLLMKKTTHSTSTNSRNQLTGQLAGDSANGRIADEEAYALMTVGANAVVDEMFGPRADNRQKRLQMYRDIQRDGFVQYQNLTGDSKDQPTLGLFDVHMLAAGIKTDVITQTDLLRITADKPVA